jgi:serine/threonine protein kinase
MVYGYLPFAADTLSELQVAQCAGIPVPQQESKVSIPCSSLIASLLVVCPDDRLTAEEILHHQWFSPARKRYSAAVKNHNIDDMFEQAVHSDICASILELPVSTLSKGLEAENVAIAGIFSTSHKLDNINSEACPALALKTRMGAGKAAVAPSGQCNIKLSNPKTVKKDAVPTLPQMTVGVTSPRAVEGIPKPGPAQQAAKGSFAADKPSNLSSTSFSTQPFDLESATQSFSQRVRERTKLRDFIECDADLLAVPASPPIHQLTTGKRVVRRRRSRARSATNSPF